MIEYQVRVHSNGDREWRVNDQLHREDAPAVERASGTRMWFVNGQLHRTDGPAVEWANGDRYWYLNGQLHREDAPAVERANGDRMWYVNGRQVSESQVMNKPIKLTVAEIEARLGCSVEIVS